MAQIDGSCTGGLVGLKHSSPEEHATAHNAISSVPPCFEGWLLYFLLLCYYFPIVSHVILVSYSCWQTKCGFTHQWIGGFQMCSSSHNAISIVPLCFEGCISCFIALLFIY